MKISIFGTEIYISFPFAAVIAAMLALDGTGYALPLISAIALHESGHLFMMWALGCPPKKIRLVPAAVEVTGDINYGGNNESKIAIAGPLINLTLFLGFGFCFYAFGNIRQLEIALINLLIGLFNLLPVSGLDGGTILLNLLLKISSPEKSCLIMRLIGLFLAAAAVFTGTFLLFRGMFNPSLFIIALYILTMSLIKV